MKLSVQGPRHNGAKQFLKSNLRIRTPVIDITDFSKKILVATNQDEKILLEILKRNKTENNLNPKLSEKLLPLKHYLS